MPATCNTPTKTKLPPPVTEGGALLETSMGENCEYVRLRYQVPVEIGRHIITKGN
jgi:hypothetical protein